MTEISRPWTGTTTGDAGAYSADNWSSLQRYGMAGDGSNVESGPITGSGVSPDPGLTVTQRGAGANMSVDVSAGAALVNGTFYITDATVNLAITSNASGNPRIDTVILKKDWSLQTIRLSVKVGTPAATPVPPTLVQSAGTSWEIPIADVAVANGAVSITTANVTPRRSPANVADGVYLHGILNNSGGTLQTGDVVVWDTSADRAVKTSTTLGDTTLAGVWVGRTASGAYGRLLVAGVGFVNVNAALATRGLGLIQSGTAKQAASGGNWMTSAQGSSLGAFAINLETSGGAGLVRCQVNALRLPLTAAYKHALRDNAGDYTTTSGTFVNVDATNLSHTLVLTRPRVLVLVGLSAGSAFYYSVLSYIDVTIDGTAYAAGFADGYQALPSSTWRQLAFIVDGLSIGSHTFNLVFKSATGGSTCGIQAGRANAGHAEDTALVFDVVELP